LDVSSRNKPIGTFLFLGPTGVGKTETAKALATQYFGGENRLVRFDMSQYQGEEGIQRLIGNSQSNKPGELTQALSDHPFSVLLLDEIEKAPQLVLNLFLTLIDEGYLTDATGKKFSAKENIIIGTSNAGALFIKDESEKGTPIDQINSGLLNFVQEQKIFSPEFLNRFDGVIVFRPLSKDELKLVVKKLLGGLAKRLMEKKITVEFTPETIEKIVTEGYDPAFGARSVRRYIQDVIEDEISKKLLRENVTSMRV
jgi:ATP-dependent Clp protease ATP-binding subunit ClpA